MVVTLQIRVVKVFYKSSRVEGGGRILEFSEHPSCLDDAM